MHRTRFAGFALALGLLVIAQLAPSLSSLAAPGGAKPAAAAKPAPQTARTAYARLPLAFEPNQGQTASQVRFLARGAGYTLFLTPDQASLSLQPSPVAPGGEPRSAALMGASSSTAPPALVSMRWLGANPNPVITGEVPLPGTVNQFIGNDPAKWRTNIPTYQQVRLHDVYPGIDLIYYGDQGQLEYDFVVAPGADPARIQLGFSGVRGLALSAGGDLSLALPGGAIQQQRPTVYQVSGGARQTVAGGYTLAGGRVSFALGAYDRSLPLVIDPVFKYSTYLGGNGSDYGYGIAVDSSGDAYVAGYTASTNFPTTGGVVSTTLHGGTDVFVTKYNPAGTAIIYSTYVGGNGYDDGAAIAVDKFGNTYVTGSTTSTDFPFWSGVQSSFGGGTDDAFAFKLNYTGAVLVFSTYLGGNDLDEGTGIAVDSQFFVYITGGTRSANFPTTSGAVQTTIGGGSGGVYDAFVTELEPAGNAYYYSTFLGGSGGDYAHGIAVDGSFNAYVSGQTNSTDFPTLNALQGSNGGGTDGFVASLNVTGTVLNYSTYLGGSGSDFGDAIALDPSADAWVCGNTGSTNFPTLNPLQSTSGGGGADAFVTSISPAGALNESTYFGGNGYDECLGIAVAQTYQVSFTGDTNSTNLPGTGGGPQNSYAGGGDDAFVAQIGVFGFTSTYLGGSTGGDYGYAIAVNQGGNVYVTGRTTSTDFPAHNALQATFGGGSGDAFVAKLNMRPFGDTGGVWRPSNQTFYLTTINAAGPPTFTATFGATNDVPISGDWTGQGFDTIGVFRPSSGTFYLRNGNSTGPANISVTFGTNGDIPLAGDWNGKGFDSIGVYRPSNNTFYLRNSNTTGGADINVTFGTAGDIPVVGDWTGKGYDSIGIYRPSTHSFYLRNTNTTGGADIVVTFGTTGDIPVVGDWTAKGYASIGIWRPSTDTFYLRNSNTNGGADIVYAFGASTDKPVMGDWCPSLCIVKPPHAPAAHHAAQHPAPAWQRPGAAVKP